MTMKAVLAVDQLRDAQVVARFLEAVRLPRGTALSIVHVIEVPHLAPRFSGQQGILADWRKAAATGAHAGGSHRPGSPWLFTSHAVPARQRQ